MRARLGDNGDGTYKVQYTPSVSGKYSIAISLFGVSLPGSPWGLEVPHHAATTLSPRDPALPPDGTPHSADAPRPRR